MPIQAKLPLKHNFAIWLMGRRPGWFKPQRYMYRCLRCKWAFVVNDEGRGSLRVAIDTGGVLPHEEELRRLVSFTDGPCPGYQTRKDTADELPDNVVPLRRENRQPRSARDLRAG